MSLKNERIIHRIDKWIPLYAIVPLVFEMLLNNLVYISAKMITEGWHHYNMELSIDRRIPVMPWMVSVYLGCYLFWGINYVIGMHFGKEQTYRLLSADFLAKVVCFVCFLLIPTTNVRPVLVSDGIWNQLLLLVYRIDSPDNLFPSIHCLTSWFCFIAVRKQKAVPVGYRIFSCLMALMVFISTMATRQHVLVDVLAGYALAEIMYFLTVKTGFVRLYQHVFEKIRFQFWKKSKWISRYI